MSEQRPKSMLTESPRFLPHPLFGDSTRSPTHGLRSPDLASSIRLSIRLAALSSEVDTTRSIGGRLGGRFNSHQSLKSLELGVSHLSIPRLGVIDVPTEISKLVPPSPGLSIESTGDDDSPPLATWLFPALCCASAYAFYNIFIKKGSATIHPILGGVILQFVAALLGVVLLASLMLSADKSFKLHYDRNGLIWSVAAGLAVGLAEMLSFCVSGLGVPATQSIPVIIGGSVMFGAILGVILLGEKLMLHGWSGILILVIGIVFIALDPGEKVEEGGGSNIVDDDKPPAYWVLIALICANAYAFYNIFIKKGSSSIDPILGGVILQFVAAAFGTMLLGTILMKDGGISGLNCDRVGLFWACMAGVAVGTAEMLSFVVSGMGVNSTQSIPVIIGGSVLVGAVLGMLMLGETMMLPGLLGIALLTIGIGLVATDPGEKVAGH